jgi:hypothetical protein
MQVLSKQNKGAGYNFALAKLYPAPFTPDAFFGRSTNPGHQHFP